MDDQKELYRLWFEYLKRSDDYKEYCEFVRLKIANPFLPYPDKFEGGGDSMAHKRLFFQNVYKMFFNVHEINFQKWWQHRNEKIAFEQNSPSGGLIEELRTTIIFDYLEGLLNVEDGLEYCISNFAELEGREPTARELKDCYVGNLKDNPEIMLLMVSLNFEPKDIKKAFDQIIESKKQEFANLKPGRWITVYRNKKPTGKPRIDELQKYLDVYDLWKEKVQNRQPGDPSGWDEIIQHFEPGRTVSNDGDRRVYLRYKQNAEKIISNVEEGYFPGEY
ncbi:MAG: hypothetical protein ISS66_05560 [Desulfobacteraceae bacterium]|nr:hypothetical protein [Desulfobacteraceae bacterium]